MLAERSVKAKIAKVKKKEADFKERIFEEIEKNLKNIKVIKT